MRPGRVLHSALASSELRSSTMSGNYVGLQQGFSKLNSLNGSQHLAAVEHQLGGATGGTKNYDELKRQIQLEAGRAARLHPRQRPAQRCACGATSAG